MQFVNKDRLNEAKKHYPRLKAYNSWDKMLAEENLDILMDLIMKILVEEWFHLMQE